MVAVKVTGNENVNIHRFLLISSSKLDRFTTNQDQNDPQPITQYVVVIYFSPADMLRFCDNLQSVLIWEGRV